MNFSQLSAAAIDLHAKLIEASRVHSGRTERTVAVMRQIAECPEPGLILCLLGFLLDDDPAITGTAESAIATLYRHVSTDQLPALDEAMRRHSYGSLVAGDIRWQRMTPGQASTFTQPDASTCALLLGLAACHASGYVRRNAVACLDQRVQNGAEIPFLLLRLGDWVEPVRLQAQSAVSRRLDTEPAAAFLPYLGLLEQLRAKRRMSESPLLPRIERVLQTDMAALLNASFSASGRLARRYGLTLAWRAADSASARTLIIERTLRAAKDQSLRLQVVNWLAAKDADPELQRRFMRSLLSDRLPAARRLALGWCMSREPSLYQDELQKAVLDSSRTVRAIAQFYLTKLGSFDLQRFYRQEMLDGSAAHLLPAMGGLAEIGKAEDVQMFVPLVYSPRVAVRKAALAAVAKLAGASGEYLELFVTALQDGGNPGVSRQARLALERCAAEVGRERLASIFFCSPHLHVRRQALSLINRLPKWQRVALLVEVIGRGGPEEETTVTATHFLRDWFANYNRSHAVTPTRQDVAQLDAVLRKYDGALEPRLGRELRALVESWTR